MLTARVEPAAAAPPPIQWRWEPETDILSGSYRVATRGERAEAVEISSPAGAVLVLDVIEGELCGLDVVIWPELETDTDLVPPSATVRGRVVLSDTPAPPVEAPLAVTVDGLERTFHIRVGRARLASVVQVADHFLIELDGRNRVAGFWLTHVPPFPGEELG
jgi:hypothetical protein